MHKAGNGLPPLVRARPAVLRLAVVRQRAVRHRDRHVDLVDRQRAGVRNPNGVAVCVLDLHGEAVLSAVAHIPDAVRALAGRSHRDLVARRQREDRLAFLACLRLVAVGHRVHLVRVRIRVVVPSLVGGLNGQRLRLVDLDRQFARRRARQVVVRRDVRLAVLDRQRRGIVRAVGVGCGRLAARRRVADRDRLVVHEAGNGLPALVGASPAVLRLAVVLQRPVRHRDRQIDLVDRQRAEGENGLVSLRVIDLTVEAVVLAVERAVVLHAVRRRSDRHLVARRQREDRAGRVVRVHSRAVAGHRVDVAVMRLPVIGPAVCGGLDLHLGILGQIEPLIRGGMPVVGAVFVALDGIEVCFQSESNDIVLVVFDHRKAISARIGSLGIRGRYRDRRRVVGRFNKLDVRAA